ncbi:unnamed protein product [Lampetra fluviatilis]
MPSGKTGDEKERGREQETHKRSRSQDTDRSRKPKDNCSDITLQRPPVSSTLGNSGKMSLATGHGTSIRSSEHHELVRGLP